MENIPYELIARYLAGECNDSEKLQIEGWIEQHPDLMAGFTKLWQQIPSDDFSPDVEQALLNVNQRICSNKKKRSKGLFMFIGSVAAVAVLIISIVGIKNINTPTGTDANLALVELNTKLNETQEYQLPDGSKIWLNQSSSIKYPEEFKNDIREVYLEGEAFFDIAPDKDRPFIIHANNTETRVVGTSFGIRAVKDENEVVVTVSTGIVNFSTEGKAEQIQLKQGDQGICKPKQYELEKSTNPDPNLLAWKTKILTFKQTSLTEVGKVIENAYHTPISIDNSVANLQITSTFDQLSLDEVLQIIEITLQIQSKTNKDGILLTAK